MQVKPERTNVRGEANYMENYAVPVLGMRNDAPGPQVWCGMAHILAHRNLNAAAMAMTVNVRLTHGPQSIAPRMMTRANSGKNDLPKTRPVPNNNLCLRFSILHSFLVRTAARCCCVCA